MKYLMGFLAVLACFSCKPSTEVKYTVLCASPDGFVLQLDDAEVQRLDSGVIVMTLPNGRKVMTHLARCVLVFPE